MLESIDLTPLERRMVECPKCFGRGSVHNDGGDGDGAGWSVCYACGDGEVPERAEVWAERLSKMCLVLAEPEMRPERILPGVTRESIISGRLKAAEKAKRYGGQE